jgi:hypothetical protein
MPMSRGGTSNVRSTQRMVPHRPDQHYQARGAGPCGGPNQPESMPGGWPILVNRGGHKAPNYVNLIKNLKWPPKKRKVSYPPISY